MNYIDSFNTEFFTLVKLFEEKNLLLYESEIMIIDPRLVYLAKTFLHEMDKKYIIDRFIAGSIIYWDKIIDKDEDFFMNYEEYIFEHIPTIVIVKIKQLLTQQDERFMIKEFKEKVFSLLRSMICIAVEYAHAISEPYYKITSKGTQLLYRKTTPFDILHYANKLELELVYSLLLNK